MSGVMLQRRGFLAVLAGTGLSLAFDLHADASSGTRAGPAQTFTPNAFLRIEADGQIVLIAPAPDMGQGVKTSLPMLLAEELDVGLDQVRVEQASLDNRMGPLQNAGGSTSVAKNWRPLREAGAAARWLLVGAAAQTWGVSRASLRTERGMVIHDESKQVASYASLANAAAQLSLPEHIPLKDARSFRLIGQRQNQVDGPLIVRGAPLYCGDQRPPGCLIAVVIKAPVFGGKPQSDNVFGINALAGLSGIPNGATNAPVIGSRPHAANLDALKAMPGIVDAFILEAKGEVSGDMVSRSVQPALQAAVAIVARNTWSALKARSALQVTWEPTAFDAHSSGGYSAESKRLLEQPGETWRDDGDVEAALKSASVTIDAYYELPILSHNSMETMSCLAEPLPNGGLRLTSPSQFPSGPVEAITSVLGIPKEKIELHIPRLGGAFGRRWEVDFALDASAIALKMGAPILLFTPREEDMRHDFYRPFESQRIRAGVDADGKLVAWDQDRVLHSFRNPQTPKITAEQFPVNFIPHLRIRARMVASNVPAGAYRAPPANLHAFFIESAFNELAYAAKIDPLVFRLQVLGEDRELKDTGFSPTRMKGVLRLAATKADWGDPLPKGRARGIASWFSHAGYVAHVIELSVSQTGVIKLHRVTSAVDVGQIINLHGAEQQVQGSVIDALSGALLQRITLNNGAVEQSNFHDNPMLRMPDVPHSIDVHFVESERSPTGLGEPAYPAVAPALVGALLSATGKPIRSLPLSQHDLSWS